MSFFSTLLHAAEFHANRFIVSQTDEEKAK